MDNGINKIEEYKTLRDELKESKRYVFERPLLAIAAIFAAAQFVDKHQIAFLPLIAATLLMFNFWFTVNRLRSSTRIVAYIQVVLENMKESEVIGWETFLRYQRIWLKKNRDRVQKIIDENIDKDAIPDALFYYPAIFNFHVALMVIAFIASIGYAWKNNNVISYLFLSATALVVAYFFNSIIKSRPSKMRRLIEENRIIIIKVLEFIRELEGRSLLSESDTVETEIHSKETGKTHMES